MKHPNKKIREWHEWNLLYLKMIRKRRNQKTIRIEFVEL